MTATADTLNTAANLIDARGWCHGSGWGVDGEVGLCLEGALVAAEGRPPFDAVAFGYTNRTPAGRALREWLGLDAEVGDPGTWRDHTNPGQPGSGAPLFVWNDAPGRSQLEVTVALRAAALVEAARERDTAAVGS